MIFVKHEHSNLVGKIVNARPPEIRGVADEADAEAVSEHMALVTRAVDLYFESLLLDFANRKRPIYSAAQMEAFKAKWRERAEARRHCIALNINSLDPLDPCHLHNDSDDTGFDVRRERDHGWG